MELYHAGGGAGDKGRVLSSCEHLLFNAMKAQGEEVEDTIEFYDGEENELASVRLGLTLKLRSQTW